MIASSENITTPPAPAPEFPASPAPAAEKKSSLKMITLRIPPALKDRIDRMAARDGKSVNAFLQEIITDNLDMLEQFAADELRQAAT